MAGVIGTVYYFFFRNSGSVPVTSSASASASASATVTSLSSASGVQTAPIITTVLNFTLKSSPTPLCPLNSVIIYNPALSTQITFNGGSLSLTDIQTTSTLITANVSISGTSYPFSLNSQIGTATLGTNLFGFLVPSSSSGPNSVSGSSSPSLFSGYTQYINGDVDGFDITYSHTASTCSSVCDALDTCVGFSINSTNTICNLKAAYHGTGNFSGSLDNYFEKDSNENRCFILYNVDANAFACIENGGNWNEDYGEGKYVNLRNPTEPSNPIPSKAVWRYDSNFQTFVNVPSCSFVYSDNNGQLRITYDSTKIGANPFYYRNGKIVSTLSASSYWVGDSDSNGPKYVAIKLKSNSSDNDRYTTWKIFFLPKPTPVQSFPTNNDIFFLIKTKNKILNNNTSYGYLAATTDISSGNTPVIMLTDLDVPFNNKYAIWEYSSYRFLCIRYYPKNYVSAQGDGLSCSQGATIRIYNDNVDPNSASSSTARVVGMTSDGYISVAGNPDQNGLCGLYIGKDNTGVLILTDKTSAIQFSILPINIGDMYTIKNSGVGLLS